METNGFFSRDSEAAFGSESATRGGSFWTRIRLGKAVAAPGVRGQDAREKWKKTIAGEARFGRRGGTRCSGPGCARKMEEKYLCSRRIQQQRLAPKVRPGKAKMVYFNRDAEEAFGIESATRGGSFWARIRLRKAVA